MILLDFFGLVPALFQTIKELEQAKPLKLLGNIEFVPLFQQKRGGVWQNRARIGRTKQGSAAR